MYITYIIRRRGVVGCFCVCGVFVCFHLHILVLFSSISTWASNVQIPLRGKLSACRTKILM